MKDIALLPTAKRCILVEECICKTNVRDWIEGIIKKEQLESSNLFLSGFSTVKNLAVWNTDAVTKTKRYHMMDILRSRGEPVVVVTVNQMSQTDY